jgi:hypothetical protein
MDRRRLWDVSCLGIDALLCTSFDPDELVSLDPKFQCALDIPDHPAIKVPHALIVYGIAHKACHSDNPTSRRLEKRLDVMHQRALRECAASDHLEFLASCYSASEEAREDLAGCLWAVFTDPRQELRQHGLFWVQGLIIRSLVHWMHPWREFREKRVRPAETERERMREQEEGS